MKAERIRIKIRPYTLIKHRNLDGYLNNNRKITEFYPRLYKSMIWLEIILNNKMIKDENMWNKPTNKKKDAQDSFWRTIIYTFK